MHGKLELSRASLARGVSTGQRAEVPRGSRPPRATLSACRPHLHSFRESSPQASNVTCSGRRPQGLGWSGALAKPENHAGKKRDSGVRNGRASVPWRAEETSGPPFWGLRGQRAGGCGRGIRRYGGGAGRAGDADDGRGRARRNAVSLRVFSACRVVA